MSASNGGGDCEGAQGTRMVRKTIRFRQPVVAHVEGLVEQGEYVSFSAAVRDQLPDEWRE